MAKVARDRYMAELPADYAGYGFAAHVGYGTTAHRAALASLGVSDIHRRSYKPIRALLT
jgi:ribonuclease HII